MYVCSGITIPQLDPYKLRGGYSERNIGDLAGNAFNTAALFVCLSVVFSLLGTASPKNFDNEDNSQDHQDLDDSPVSPISSPD